MKIGVITSRFNSEITDELERGCVEYLNTHGLNREQVIQLRVPGAVELPLVAKLLLQKNCDAVIVLGCVIRGETTHYDSVCRMAESGCMQVMLEMQKPIIFGLITTENDEQAQARIGGAHGHKGVDAAQAALEMIRIDREIKGLTQQ